MYADFDYYAHTYGGTVIDSADFGYYERKAEKYINTVTFGRVSEDNLSDDIRDAVCEVAELYFDKKSSSASKGIASEKIGDYSVSYSDSLSGEKFSRALYDAAKEHLADTGLLYRGDDT